MPLILSYHFTVKNKNIMAFSKAKIFDPLPYHQSVWSKALAHPARIIILNHLLQNGITPFHEIRKQIPLATTTVSQHIKLLLNHGLIDAEEKFPYTYYKLNQKVCRTLALKISGLNSGFGQCG